MATEHASGHQSSNHPASIHPGGHSAMDYAEHNRTYAGFVKATIGLIVACAIILIGMAAFLV